jgi:hypothetical protein
MAKNVFKNLTDKDKQYITLLYYDINITHREKTEILCKKYSVNERTIRSWWKDKLNLTEKFSKLPLQLREAQDRQIDEKTNILLVTSAQNKTGININFLNNLKRYRDFLNEKGFKAQILITPSRYRNPTSPIEELSDNKKKEEWWRDEVTEFLHYGKRQFGDTLISSDSRVRPTAKEPLQGYEVLAKNNNLIIPHPKIHFKTLPRFKNKPLRVMCTTGFITYKNYSDSKAGDQAFENHSMGFVVIEKKKDGVCHVPRNVKATADGDFVDIIYHVTNEGVSTIDYSEGFIWGDIHTRVLNKEILNSTFLLLDLLKPKKQILHDVLDGSAFNPHEKKDMFIQRQKIINGQHLIDKEVDEALDVIETINNRVGCDTYVAISNHDVFLDRHINDENWKRDLHNSPAFLKYAYIQQTVNLNDYGCIFGYLVNEKFLDKVKYLNFGESLDICGYECASHGDFGVNGAKGSVKSFSNLNTKMIHAHGHSPTIHNGVTMVGVTSLLEQYYNRKGLSSWAYAHSVIHPTCKNQLLVFGDDGLISSLI